MNKFNKLAVILLPQTINFVTLKHVFIFRRVKKMIKFALTLFEKSQLGQALPAHLHKDVKRPQVH